MKEALTRTKKAIITRKVDQIMFITVAKRKKIVKSSLNGLEIRQRQ